MASATIATGFTVGCRLRSPRQRRPILRPVDDFEKHSPLDHFGLEIGRVLFPVRCFANAESGFPTLCLGRIIRCQRPAHALVHHGEAVVREGLIVHRATTLRRDEDAILGWTFKGPRALTPPVSGATTNPERWLWTSLWTLKEGASSGGPPDFRPRALKEQHRLERQRQHQQLTAPDNSRRKTHRVESAGLRPAPAKPRGLA